MFRYVPFEEIEKNKWNGTVHYALNGNVQGYYWYLKAVLHEWGAIVENDYETVVPVLLSPLKDYQYELLKELGPYSVNLINKNRSEEILRLLDKHNGSYNYPVNSTISPTTLEKYPNQKRLKAVYPGGKKYLDMSNGYSDSFDDALMNNGFEDITIMSGQKPEKIVELMSTSKNHKNALLRLMYNAMHRGVGFSNGIQRKSNGKVLALSFFIGMPTSMSELLSYNSSGAKYRQLIFDLILRKNSERPVKIESFFKVDELMEIGFDQENITDIILKNKRSLSFKNLFKRFSFH